MTDFATVVRRFMTERGMSLRATAAAANYDPGLLSKVLNGHKPYSPYLAVCLDRALGAGGEIEAAARRSPPQPSRPGRRRKPSRAVEAIAALADSDPGSEPDSLAGLVTHYAQVVATAPSAAVYDELVTVRSYAGTLLTRGQPRGRADLTVTAGWFSGLLAATAADLGEHAAAVVWCQDAERRGSEAGYPELLGWAALTRALIAWYQGNPEVSAALAGQGYCVAPEGTVARARLASHEMRSRAMLSDTAGTSQARRRAFAAMEQLAPAAPASGVFGVPPDSDPPYTATSLLAEGRHREAAAVTRRIIGSVYRPQSRPPGEQPTRYARTLLILALAAAGLGDADEAAAAGAAALDCGRLVWPTMVLAGQLDVSLARGGRGTAHSADFHARYVDAAGRLALPAAQGNT